MQMHIRKRLHDQFIAVIQQRRIAIPIRESMVNAGNHAVLQHQIPVFGDLQPPQRRSLDNMTFQNLYHETIPLFR